MWWHGQDEWRVQWYAAPTDTQHRVRAAVRSGRALTEPDEAALAVGLALSRLFVHRWLLLVIPWVAGVGVVLAMMFAAAEPGPATAVAVGVGGGTWLTRLLLVGPRLRRAYLGNLEIARASIRARR